MNRARLTTLSNDLKALQDRICAGLEVEESKRGGATFQEDAWERPGGGGGRTRVLTAGKVWERGGVNFSEVEGDASEALKAQMNTSAERFWAAGVSLVLHPNNPHVPIVHMNVRHFALSDGTSWFGGGIDLTPHYVNPEEATTFHRTLKATCDSGIFFDHLGRDGASDVQWEQHKALIMDVGETFLPAYLPVVKANVDAPFTDAQRDWQLHRRGRYVEFNLVWDRGTRFGLVSNGRTESILMSLPPEVKWTYALQPGEAERDTLSWLKQGVDWAGTPTKD